MKPITQEWINKAEGDWSSAQREARARRTPNFDAACFHAQQCAEKYLKARLQEALLPFPKTHDLEKLLKLVATVEPGWNGLSKELRDLNDFAVDIRYPGPAATKSDAQEAIKNCRRVRAVIRTAFGLPV